MTVLSIQRSKSENWEGLIVPPFSPHPMRQLQYILPLRQISNFFPTLCLLCYYLSLGPYCFLLKHLRFFNYLPASVTLHSTPSPHCSKRYPLHSDLLHSDLQSGIHSTLIFSVSETSKSLPLTCSKVQAPYNGIQGSSQPGSYCSFHHPVLLLTILHPLLCCIRLIISVKMPHDISHSQVFTRAVPSV